jgi:hypothetical protein
MAEFDPDEYLRQKGAEAFDPDAYLAAKGAAPKSAGPSEVESAVLGVASGGTLGFVDEIGGALGKLFVPESGVQLGAASRPSTGDSPEEAAIKADLAKAQPSSYQLTRDAIRRQEDEARAANPKAFMAGEIAGAVALPMPGGAALKGGTLAAKAARAAGQGAGMGAAYGVGASEAASPGGVLLDAATGASAGALGGAAGAGVAAGVGKVSPIVRRYLAAKLGRAAEGLDEFSAVRALKAAGYINKDVKKAIATGGKDRLIQTGKDLRDTGAVRAFSSVEDVGERAAELADKQGSRISDLLKEADKYASTADLPSGAAIAKRINREIADDLSANPSLADLAPQVRARAHQYAERGEGPASLADINQWKSAMNRRQKWGADPSTGEELNRSIGRIIKEEVDATVDAVAPKKLAGEFQEAKRLYGSLAPTAKKLAGEGLARDIGNRAVSPSDYLMAIGGLASGGVAPAVALGAGNKLMRTYGSSTLSVAAGGMSRQMSAVQRALQQNPQALGRYAVPLASAAARGEQSLASAHFVLAQRDPGYRQQVEELASAQ